MDTPWLNSASDRLSRLRRLALLQLRSMADPRRVGQVKGLLYALAGLWLLLAVANMVWALLPQPQPQAVAIAGPGFNPLQSSAGSQQPVDVNIEEVVAWNLFGTAASKPVPRATIEEQGAGRGTGDLDGIENTAKQTTLNIKLQGIVASSDVGLARAMIESQRQQKQYAVGDKLPVSGKVSVAKILTDRVVLDNGGQYELLMLFDKSALAATPMQSARATAKPARQLDRRGSKDVTQMAEAYRQRLYTNPQSLSDVVKIAAVRQDGQLRGYRVSAGKDSKQFVSLGFQANDIVTSVNGVELTDPGKAMELYRIMRSAEEASFNVRRGEEDITLVIELGNAADSQ